MSEYQYYEFLAIDRPLTTEQMAQIRAYSSRAHITAHSFVNVYSWGNFKGKPGEWMEKYFDAFLYISNWGVRRFLLRLPEKLLTQSIVDPYCTDERFTYWCNDGNIILSFIYNEEGGNGDEDGEGLMAELISIRADLLRGDGRALYLGWLGAVSAREVNDNTLEPPVPANLGNLSASLVALANLLGVDIDLIAAAAEGSATQHDVGLSEQDIREWVSNLADQEKDSLLMQFISGGNPHLATELQQCIRSTLQGEENVLNQPRRTAGDLLDRAKTLKNIRQRKEAARRAREEARREREQAEARERYLDSLTGKENELWAEVDKFIAAKNPYRYGEAVSLLQDLCDLAKRQGRSRDFQICLRALCEANKQRPALLNRIRDARLL